MARRRCRPSSGWSGRERSGSRGRESKCTSVIPTRVPSGLPDEDGHHLGHARRTGRFEYHNDPAKTADAWRDNEFTVGDVGHLDDDGWLFLTDRQSDMIIRAGVNIYPREIENVLYQHPAVVDCAVFGVPDDRDGEHPVAVVEVRDDRQRRRVGAAGAANGSTVQGAEPDRPGRPSCHATRTARSSSDCSATRPGPAPVGPSDHEPTTGPRSRSVRMDAPRWSAGTQPTSGLLPLPARAGLPVHRCGRRGTGRSVEHRARCGSGPRSPRRHPATKDRCRTGSASWSSTGRSCGSSAGSRSRIRPRFTSGQAMHVVTEELPEVGTVWAFAPDPSAAP